MPGPKGLKTLLGMRGRAASVGSGGGGVPAAGGDWAASKP